jgi:hypothetical protein
MSILSDDIAQVFSGAENTRKEREGTQIQKGQLGLLQ